MTSSSTRTTLPNTRLMSEKYFADSALTDFLPVQTNVSSTSLPANTSDTCCLPKASPWPHTRSILSKIGPNPWKVKDIQSFLGFANFYHHFIYGYSKITVPLTCLTCKGTTLHFSDECHSAFEALKK